MKWPRLSGILVHPTSLPSPYGIGDLGPSAIALLDFLHAGRQKVWQVLPLAPPGYGSSPYAAVSAFAGNPLLISPRRLVEDGLLGAADLIDHPAFPAERVGYALVTLWKMSLLRRAHAAFLTATGDALRPAFTRFQAAERDWLDDFALFAALKDEHGGVAWTDWSPALAARDERALAEARERLAGEIAFHRFAQFLFERQWSGVRAAARERGIRILGDLAIFVAHDSADVWAHPQLFHLNAQGQPLAVAGVPPDYFSPTGQRWGNPLYRWDALAETGYAWWIARVRKALDLYDYIRLDHFRGFQAYWEVPAESDTALGGRWVRGPGDPLFAAIRAALGGVPFIAEDLGQITIGVVRLRQRLGFPGMRVLQFGFGGDARNPHLPHNFTRDTVVYTATHDNDTTRGWFDSLGERERAHALAYLRTDAEHIVDTMMRAAYASVARLAIVPLQDALDHGSAARMNYPSRAEGNWEWRYGAADLTPALSQRLATLAALYGR